MRASTVLVGAHRGRYPSDHYFVLPELNWLT